MNEASRRQDDRDPPVFIVGCGRSGTTMLRLMMDSHPDMAIPTESHFIPAQWKARGKYLEGGVLNAERLAADILRSPHVQRWGVPEELVLRRIRSLQAPGFADVVESVFLANAEQQGKRRWGDKTPRYVRFIPLLARLFPRALFLHIIRDGRDVALSYLSLPWGPTNIWQAARKWRNDLAGGRRAGRQLGPERYLEVGYEDLVTTPREVLERVCAFARVPYSDRMLDYHRSAADRVRSRHLAGTFRVAVVLPPTQGLRDWREQMDPQDVLAFESVAGDLLSELGYERRYLSIPKRWRAWERLRMGAMDLRVAGARMKAALTPPMAGARSRRAS